MVWRMRRGTRYETEVCNVGQEEVAGTFKELDKKLKKATENRDRAQGQVESAKKALAFLESLATRADDEKVAGADARNTRETAEMALAGLSVEAPDLAEVLGLPPEAHKNIWAWTGWTAGLVRQMIGTLASAAKLTPEDLVARCLQDQTDLGREQGEWAHESQDRIDDLTCRRSEMESRRRRKRLLPDEKTLAKIARYEGLSSKEFFRTLQELRCLQAIRRGDKVPPPT
jgi:hypothetical protein